MKSNICLNSAGTNETLREQVAAARERLSRLLVRHVADADAGASSELAAVRDTVQPDDEEPSRKSAA